nr:IS66 family insertion sequence element accessory protein TnpB [Cohnella thermotolerans]
MAWCEANQVNCRQLYSWMRKLNGAPASAATEAKWVTVQSEQPLAVEAEPLVVRIGTATIEVKPGFNALLFRSSSSRGHMLNELSEEFNLDLFAPCLFAFCNRQRNKLKILRWNHNGFWLYCLTA